MNLHFVCPGAARRVLCLAAALCALLTLGLAKPGRCDRVILTPSGVANTQPGASGEVLASFAGDQATAAWAEVGLSPVELEAAYFHLAGKDSPAISLQTPILPETFATPALSVGVRDLFNTTDNVRAIGYGGRAIYAAASKSLATPPEGVFRNVTATLGLGTGSLNGLFGSVTAQMPFHLLGAFEYDGRRANTKIALPLGRTSQLEYARIGPHGFVGFALNRPVSF